MANKYGEVALVAARLEVAESVSSAQRWQTAVRQVYPEKPYLQKKAAPREAFLALCAAGLVKGIAADATSSLSHAGTRATKAVALLKTGAQASVTFLWASVTEGETVPHGAQMDVVLALWKNGLIVRD